MLSVTPVVPLGVQLASQTFEVQLISNGTLTTHYGGWSNQNIGSDLSAIHFDPAVIDAWNAYGSTGNLKLRGLIVTPAVDLAIPQGKNDWGSGLWQIVKAPQLDPVPINPPGLSPIRIGAGETGIARQPVRWPAAVDGGDMRTSSSAPVSEVSTAINKTTLSVGAVDEVAKPNWLSVTFSPDEQHRLDATKVDVRFERTMAARDPKVRFALEPSRVLSQTFCDPVAADSFGQGDAAEPSALPVPKPAASGDATQSTEQSPQGTTSETIAPAIRDAAILNWETSRAAGLIAPVAAHRQGRQSAGRQDTSIGAGDELDESETTANGSVPQFLDENKYLAGILLGVLATRSLWSYGASADAQSASGKVTLLRKRLRAACPKPDAS
jgi:hypothetical protein